MGILAFLIGCIGLLIALIRLSYQLVTKQYRRVWKTARLLGFGLCGYMVALLLVSLTSSPRILEAGQEHCFDDICVSVLQVARRPDHGYVVTVQIRNAGRGRTQRPDHLAFRIVDRQERTFHPTQVYATPSATTTTDSTLLNQFWNQPLVVGQPVTHHIGFDLPADAEEPLLISTEGGWPTMLIIGDENSFFHAQTAFRLTEH